MSIELRQAAQQAVDAFDVFSDADDFESLFALTQKMNALRTAIQQAEAQQPATAIACGIPGMAKTTCPYCEQGFAFEHEQPATGEQEADRLPPIVAGAVFDFAGFMTTRSEVIEVGSVAAAGPVAELVKEWAELRGLDLANAAVLSWQLHITRASLPATPEPVGYMNEGHIHELAMRRLPYGYVYPEAGAGASTAVYTRPAPSVPDGYVLVPIEPTQAMMNVQTWDFSSFYSPREIWAAMLAAKDSK